MIKGALVNSVWALVRSLRATDAKRLYRTACNAGGRRAEAEQSWAVSDRLLTIGLIVGVVIGAALIGKVVYDYRVYRALSDEGRVASATVSALKPAHNRLSREGRWVLYYTFKTADNQTIDGAVGVRKALATRLHVGQSVDVVYDPANPATSALNPEQAWVVVLSDERVLVPYFALLMVLVWNIWERRRGRHR